MGTSTMTEKAEATVTFKAKNGLLPEHMAELLEQLGGLDDQPITEIKLTIAAGSFESLLAHCEEIAHQLRRRPVGVELEFKPKGTISAIRERDLPRLATVTPLDRALTQESEYDVTPWRAGVGG
jgi:hypothetical protein